MKPFPTTPNSRPLISVKTETTETTDKTAERGRLYFDASCAFCTRWINRIRGPLEKRNIHPVPFANGAAEDEMRLRWQDGREFGGADAIIFLSTRIWWACPLRAAAVLPGVRNLLARGYRHIAANRHCRNGACTLETVSPAIPNRPARPSKARRAGLWLNWGPLLLLTALAWLAGRIPIQEGWIGDSTLLNQTLPAWLWMWLLAGALWIGFKWMAWTAAGGWPALGKRTLAYAPWVGMDARSFTSRQPEKRLPIRGALMRFAAGTMLIWLAVPAIENPVIRGWLGMTGVLLVLHFGLFEVFAALWNRAGFPVRPIMNAPWRARSLTEFWGERWNRAFSDVARITVFRPLVRKLGPATGTMAGFLFSGLAHELVISVPASGGYGLPTLYFLFQGIGVIAERRFHLRGTPAGRAFLWVVLLAPAFWLFHPPFMTTVIDPFLEFLTFTA